MSVIVSILGMVFAVLMVRRYHGESVIKNNRPNWWAMLLIFAYSHALTLVLMIMSGIFQLMIFGEVKQWD